MTYQNHPQPRYFAMVAFFIIVAQGANALVSAQSVSNLDRLTNRSPHRLPKTEKL
jgi:hypothetical protein